MPKPVSYKNGSLLYCKGEEAEKVYILQSGKISLVYEDIETGKNISEQVQPGEFFGEKSALGRYPREENAIALADSVVAAFFVTEFELFAMSNTKIILKMLKKFSSQMRQIHVKIFAHMEADTLPPDNGLFDIGEKYLKNKRYSYAKYVFNRYLACYPGGKDAAKAKNNLHIVEIAMAQAAQEAASKKTAPKIQAEQQKPEVRAAVPEKAGIAMEMDTESLARFIRTFRPGEIIFSEFEPGETFYLIQSGRVHLLKNAGQYECTLGILEPPDMFGEMAILEKLPRTATVIAIDEVKAIELNAQNFEILMLGNPAMAFKLLCLFAKRIFDTKRRLMILALPDPPAKVADVFVMLDETQANLDKSTESRKFNIGIEDVARWAGISALQAKDTLYAFATQKRLTISSGYIEVRNINDFTRYVNSRRNQ